MGEADEFLAEMQVAKKPRLDPEAGGGNMSSVASAAAEADDVEAWADMPPWLVDGAGVIIRAEHGNEADVECTIVRTGKSSCAVRINSSGIQRDVSTPQLLPMTPKVGATVKVVAGDRC